MTLVIGVDPHKQTHTAVAVKAGSGELVDELSVSGRAPRYAQLLAWALAIDGRAAATPAPVPTCSANKRTARAAWRRADCSAGHCSGLDGAGHTRMDKPHGPGAAPFA
jgi:hypothetical protein